MGAQQGTLHPEEARESVGWFSTPQEAEVAGEQVAEPQQVEATREKRIQSQDEVRMANWQ